MCMIKISKKPSILEDLPPEVRKFGEYLRGRMNNWFSIYIKTTFRDLTQAMRQEHQKIVFEFHVYFE